MENKAMSKTEKLIRLVKQFPGRDAAALKANGWRLQSHGSLREAEQAGVLEYRHGGWYVKE